MGNADVCMDEHGKEHTHGDQNDFRRFPNFESENEQRQKCQFGYRIEKMGQRHTKEFCRMAENPHIW